MCVLLNFIIILPVSLVIKGRGKGGRGRDTQRERVTEREREREREREEVSIILDWCFIYHVIVDCCLTAFGTSFSFLFYLVLSFFPPLNSTSICFPFCPSPLPPSLPLSLPSLSSYKLDVTIFTSCLYCLYVYTFTHSHMLIFGSYGNRLTHILMTLR